MSSLATFLVGIYASRFLKGEALGIYALFYSAFLFASMISTQLPYTPIAIRALDYDRSQRTGLLAESVRLGVIPSSMSLVVIAVAIGFARPHGPRHLIAALALTAAAATVVSPLQNHVRRLLHLAARSWAAAAVSGVQLATTLAAVVIAHESGVHREWIPFGGLALANVASLAYGAYICRNPHTAAIGRLRFADLRRSGGWLLVQAFAASGTAFAVSAIVASVVGATELGYAEASRIAAQPLFVLFVGLSAALGPGSMEAAAALDRTRARKIAWAFNGIVVGGGLLYMLVAGFPWQWNPIRLLAPAAFAVPGLTLVSMLAEIGRGIASPYKSELLGARKEAALARIEIGGGALRMLTLLGAPVLQAFVVPVSFCAMNTYRTIGQNLALHRHYRNAAPPQRTDDGEHAYERSSS